jgi:flagellar biosynthesis protein FliP
VRLTRPLIAIGLLIVPMITMAGPADLTAITVQKVAGDGAKYSVSLQILAAMTFLTFLPAMLMTMTAFTRIIIVLSILRQAIGLAQTPSNQILIGISLFLSFFVMSPVFNQANTQALQPYLNNQMSMEKAMSIGQKPFREFMINQTRTNDLNLFLDISGTEPPEKVENVPLYVLMPAFLTSELKTSFQIGFMLFLPFLIVDLVVASVLMSMGMMMLSPLIISLPFKIMLFVLIDGWTLIVGTLAASFAT